MVQTGRTPGGRLVYPCAGAVVSPIMAFIRPIPPIAFIPMAVLSGVLAPFAGRILDRVDPRVLLVPGLSLMVVGLVGYVLLMNTEAPVLLLLIPSAIIGVANAGMWGPLATTATHGRSFTWTATTAPAAWRRSVRCTPTMRGGHR